MLRPEHLMYNMGTIVDNTVLYNKNMILENLNVHTHTQDINM